MWVLIPLSAENKRSLLQFVHGIDKYIWNIVSTLRNVWGYSYFDYISNNNKDFDKI